MRIEFLAKFNKDLIKIKDKSLFDEVFLIIKQVKLCSEITSVKNIKKLKGFKNAYRIRIGDFRIGVFVDGDLIEFARIVHRKDIYKLFP